MSALKSEPGAVATGQKFKPKSTEQLRAIFGLGRKRGCGKEELEELAADVTNERVDRLSGLSFDEANAMIRRLGGDPFPGEGDVSRRTLNYRRQKAGVKQLETVKHLSLIDELARLRNMTPEGLEKLCQRMLNGKRRPTTTAEGNKIVEALKAMNRRDGLYPRSTVTTKEAA